MKDEKLNDLLQTWKATVDLPTAFERSVWTRIEEKKPAPASSPEWLTAFFLWLARPIPAAATCALALTAGLLAGGIIQRPDVDSRAAAYAQSIDPLARHRAP
ncbi:hypothetical protein [Roseimicrobium sp. ORNL1]|uniref:hypothetical protein n=1 Tax=Roseimicrobium sp. ORNL1 TaxID=2711231 RepID=UPI001980663D|nr:hypothetical protein [Roseimicrobium sp. ORNL1]